MNYHLSKNYIISCMLLVIFRTNWKPGFLVPYNQLKNWLISENFFEVPYTQYVRRVCNLVLNFQIFDNFIFFKFVLIKIKQIFCFVECFFCYYFCHNKLNT
jgi:hypothetical protein